MSLIRTSVTVIGIKLKVLLSDSDEVGSVWERYRLNLTAEVYTNKIYGRLSSWASVGQWSDSVANSSDAIPDQLDEIPSFPYTLSLLKNSCWGQRNLLIRLLFHYLIIWPI